MSLIISNNFSGNIGDVTVGDSNFISFEIEANDGMPVEILDILFIGGSTQFSLFAASPPFVLVAPTTIQITFSPVGAGADSQTLQIVSAATNSPTNFDVFGNGVAAGTKALAVNPAGVVFPDTKVGVTSAEVIFTITNTGTVNVQVTALTFSVAPFTIGPTSPGLPATILPGNTLDFGADFTPAARGYLTGTVSVVSDAAASPFVVSLAGMGILITPAYIVTSGVFLHLFGFANNAGVVAVKTLADPLSSNSEEECLIRKWLMLPFPTDAGHVPGFAYEKQCMRLNMHYEDWGLVEVTATLTTMRGQVSSQTQTLGTVAANGQVRLHIFDLMAVDEIMELKITRAANAGVLVIVDYVPKYEIKGEAQKPPQ